MAAALALTLLGCVACATLREGPGGAAQARRDFSRETFCPEHRVEAARVIPMPVPPPAIAKDPERLEMWRSTFQRRGEQEPRQTIAVSGCGTRATYACWEFSGPAEGSSAGRQLTIGSSCIAVGFAPQEPTSESTTEGPQPKTTASSR
jgi:hypothetical protein